MAASSISMARETLPSDRSLRPDHSGLIARPDHRQISDPGPFLAQRAASVPPGRPAFCSTSWVSEPRQPPAAGGRTTGRASPRVCKAAAVRTGMAVSSDRGRV